MAEYKVGDVLTLKVPVIEGNQGPIIKIGNRGIVVPGHRHWSQGGYVDIIDDALIVGCDSPFRVGDRVVVKSARPHDGYLARPATIMAELPGEPDIFMIQYDRYKNYWYRKHRSDLSKDTSQ